MLLSGKKIKELRLKSNLTLEELGIKAESSKSYIWELENKTPPRPSADKLQKIANALGVTMESLFCEGEEAVMQNPKWVKKSMAQQAALAAGLSYQLPQKTLLDEFAMAALSGLLAKENLHHTDSCQIAYDHAEAMMAERERRMNQ